MIALAWRRKDVGKGVKATGDAHMYFVTPSHSGGHSLVVYTVVTLDGDKFIGEPIEWDHHRSQKLAKATAAAYEALGDDYRPADHGGRNRLTEAIKIAYEVTP